MNKGDIYCITSPSGKKYIGQCVKILSNGKKWGYINRWKQHIREAINNTNYCRLLDKSIRKYNPDNFIIELILECDLSRLDFYENHYINDINTMTPNGYNLTTGKSCSRQSEETKNLRRLSMIGKNTGKTYPKRERLRADDNILPKYIRSYEDSSGKSGYRINIHPSLKDRSFVSKYKSKEEKLIMALEYIKMADTS